ncbi:suppressor of tub2 mutation [Nowakowskiella sp. JEL0407]|nr:suppressor of tub2 mutation [Nowakowskiella sp. JEL0407]
MDEQQLSTSVDLLLTRLSALFSGPESEENWLERKDAMTNLPELFALIVNSNNRLNYFKALEKPIQIALKSIRSAVIIATCGTISKLAKDFGPKIDPLSDFVVRSLSNVVKLTNVPMSRAGVAAVQQVILSCSFNIKHLSLFLELVQSEKSKQTQGHACGFVLNIVEKLTVDQSAREDFLRSGSVDVIQQILVKGVDTADAKARDFSRQAFVSLWNIWPEKCSHWTTAYGPNSQKEIQKMINKSKGNVKALGNDTSRKISTPRAVVNKQHLRKSTIEKMEVSNPPSPNSDENNSAVPQSNLNNYTFSISDIFDKLSADLRNESECSFQILFQKLANGDTSSNIKRKDAGYVAGAKKYLSKIILERSNLEQLTEIMREGYLYIMLRFEIIDLEFLFNNTLSMIESEELQECAMKTFEPFHELLDVSSQLGILIRTLSDLTGFGGLQRFVGNKPSKLSKMNAVPDSEIDIEFITSWMLDIIKELRGTRQDRLMQVLEYFLDSQKLRMYVYKLIPLLSKNQYIIENVLGILETLSLANPEEFEKSLDMYVGDDAGLLRLRNHLARFHQEIMDREGEAAANEHATKEGNQSMESNEPKVPSQQKKNGAQDATTMDLYEDSVSAVLDETLPDGFADYSIVDSETDIEADFSFSSRTKNNASDKHIQEFNGRLSMNMWDAKLKEAEVKIFGTQNQIISPSNSNSELPTLLERIERTERVDLETCRKLLYITLNSPSVGDSIWNEWFSETFRVILSITANSNINNIEKSRLYLVLSELLKYQTNNFSGFEQTLIDHLLKCKLEETGKSNGVIDHVLVGIVNYLDPEICIQIIFKMLEHSNSSESSTVRPIAADGRETKRLKSAIDEENREQNTQCTLYSLLAELMNRFDTSGLSTFIKRAVKVCSKGVSSRSTKVKISALMCLVDVNVIMMNMDEDNLVQSHRSNYLPFGIKTHPQWDKEVLGSSSPLDLRSKILVAVRYAQSQPENIFSDAKLVDSVTQQLLGVRITEWNTL